VSGTGGIGVGAVSRDVVDFTGGAATLRVGSNAVGPTSGGTVTVATSPNGYANVTYTGKSGTNLYTGVTTTSGAGGVGSNVVSLNVNSYTGGNTFAVASTTTANYLGGPVFAASGSLHVATTDPAGATLTYTSKTATAFTGVTKTAGTGALVVGAAVTQGSTADVHITSASAKFIAGDVGKSVSAGPMIPGTFITAVNSATDVTVNQAPLADCTKNSGGFPNAGGGSHAVVPLTGLDRLTLGAATYVSGVPQIFNSDPMTVQLSNTAVGGQGFTCTPGGSILAMTAGANADTGGFAPTAASAGLPVRIVAGATTVAANIVSTDQTGNTSATLDAPCPATAPNVVTAIQGSASIGAAGAAAPANKASMMTLGAELNLNPVLVTSSGDCGNGTTSGFMVVGGWTNPSTLYAANTSTPPASVAQVIFPTSVISFNGFVVPKQGGDPTMVGVPHYNFSFALLPTSLAECLNDTPQNNGGPLQATGLTFGIDPTTQSAAPFLPTSSGNNADPTLRSLLPISSGAFSQTIQLIENPSAFTAGSVIGTFTSTACATVLSTAAPDTHCGDG
jgi:hypothetical protein